jgi:hypothetical protein
MKKLTLAVLIAVLLTLPMSALALEKMSGGDMNGITGQAGVTIAFGGTSTTIIDFSRISWGDPDGLGAACGANAGWIIIDGEITITQVIADGETLVLDIGTTTAGATCNIAGAVNIPGGRTFVAVGLPTITNTIAVPDTITVGLSNLSTTVTGTLGLLYLRNLDVTTGTPDTLYIWAHP